MKFTIRSVFFVFVLFPFLSSSQLPDVASKSAIFELDSMISAIKTYHANPFRYISETSWDIYCTEAKERIRLTDSLSLFEFRKEAQALVSLLKDEHLEVSMWNSVWVTLRKKHRFFPFEVDEVENQLVIRKASDPSLAEWEGKKIVSINGKTSQDIIDNIKLCTGNCSSSNFEGALYHATSFDNFSRIYFLCVDQSKVYEVGFADGTAMKFVGIPDAMKEDNTDVFRYIGQHAAFVRYDGDSSAYLRVSSFYPDIYGDNVTKAKKKIAQIFSEVNQKKVKHLFVDIRGNRGGTPFYSTYLAGFFFDQPFNPFDKVYVNKNAVDRFPKKFKAERKPTFIDGNPNAILEKRLKGFQTQHPEEQLFRGKVTVLIDGGSGSASGIFCGLIANYENVNFCGVETMGDAHQMTGGQFVFIEYAESKMTLNLPLLIFSYGDDSPVYGTKPSQGIAEDLLENFELPK